jgi:hypothetical protein
MIVHLNQIELVYSKVALQKFNSQFGLFSSITSNPKLGFPPHIIICYHIQKDQLRWVCNAWLLGFSYSWCLSTRASHYYALPMMINFYMRLELYNKITKSKERFLKIFKIKMCFSLLHYSSKYEKKGYECF